MSIRVRLRRSFLPSALGLVAVAAPWTLADNGLPRPDHIVIVVEENHAYTQIMGSASAPYINSLAVGGVLMTQSYGITHPSQPNYIALFSGATQGVINDSVYPHSQFTAPNLGAKLLAAGLTFGGYSQTMPSIGYDGANFGTAPATYQRKHNPWVNWQDPTVPLPANKLPASVNMPFDGFFPSNFDNLPTISIVAPNQLCDMHDGTIQQGDAWLQQNLSAYAAWCQSHNTLLIVTFDEDDSLHSNRIATIFYGQLVNTGQASAQAVNHYSILRTLEDMYSLPHDAGSVTALPVTGIWSTPSCYPNCDASTTTPVLTANDFQCFLNSFALGSSAANCDGSTTPPVLTANDFQCFLITFAAGCT